MSRQPSYPKDAAVGSEAAAAAEAAGAPPAGSADAAAPSPPSPQRTKHIVAGAAIGIGSAAIVAALLYANRRRGDR